MTISFSRPAIYPPFLHVTARILPIPPASMDRLGGSRAALAVVAVHSLHKYGSNRSAPGDQIVVPNAAFAAQRTFFTRYSAQ